MELNPVFYWLGSVVLQYNGVQLIENHHEINIEFDLKINNYTMIDLYLICPGLDASQYYMYVSAGSPL